MKILQIGVILLLILGNLVYADSEKVKLFEAAVNDANLTYIKKHINDKEIEESLKTDRSIQRAIYSLEDIKNSKKEHDAKENIAIMLLEHGANIYYKAQPFTLLETAILEDYVNLTKYILAHVNLKKYYKIISRDNIFELIKSKNMLDLFIEKGLGDISYKSNSKGTVLHLILRGGLTYNHGLDCKNLGELKQFLVVEDVFHNRPIDWYVTHVSTKEEKECFDALVEQMHFNKKNDSLLIDMMNRDFSILSYRKLIKKGIDLNSISHGHTILGLAISGNKEKLISLLLEQKENLDINKKDDGGNSFLIKAIANKNEKLAKLLIDKGIDINVVNDIGETALFLAKNKNMKSLVDVLEKRTAKLLTKEEMQKRSDIKEYISALNYKKILKIKDLIHSGKVDINTTVNGGESPLSSFMRTSGAGNEELLIVINFLIDEGIDLNLGNDTPETLLAKAFEFNRVDIAKKLMKRGAKLESDEVMVAFSYLKDKEFILALVKKNSKLLTAANMFNETLLTGLASDGKKNLKFFNQLLEYIDIKSENRDGTYNNLFRLVEEHGKESESNIFIESLLAHGYSTSTKLHNGKNILMVALESASNLGIVKLLINHKSTNGFFNKLFGKSQKLDLNIKSRDGRGLAHYAALAQKDVLKYMIERGVKIGVHGGRDDATPLMLAIKENRKENIVLLLDKATINHEDKYGKTAINYVKEYDYSYILKPLEKMGAIANAKEHIKKMSKVYALAKKEPKGLEKILKEKDNKSLLKEYSELAKDKKDDFLDDLFEYGDLNAFKTILKNGLDLKYKNKAGFSLLALAVFHDNINVVKFLLDKKSNINALSKKKYSIFLLSSNSSVKMIKFLIKQGVNTQNDKNKILSEALRHNNKEVASYLVKNDFPLDAEEFSDDQIHYYIRNGKEQSIDFLLSQGLDVNHKVYYAFHKEPLLINAIVSWENEVAKLLIEKRADIHALIEYDSGSIFKNPPTALSAAIRHNNIEMVTLLLEKGANINTISKEDDIAPLLVALQNKHAKIAQMIIEKGCDVNVINKDVGVSALMYAAFYGYFDTVKMLVAKGADVKYKNSEGRTAYDIAKKNGYLLISDYLEKVL